MVIDEHVGQNKAPATEIPADPVVRLPRREPYDEVVLVGARQAAFGVVVKVVMGGAEHGGVFPCGVAVVLYRALYAALGVVGKRRLRHLDYLAEAAYVEAVAAPLDVLTDVVTTAGE